jgi:hypothetical protein
VRPQAEAGAAALVATGGALLAAAVAGGGAPPDLGAVSLGDIIDYGSRITGSAALLLGILAFVRGWVVPRYVFEDMKAQRDQALDLARSGTGLARAQAQTTDRASAAAHETAGLATQVAAILRQQQRGAAGGGA